MVENLKMIKEVFIQDVKFEQDIVSVDVGNTHLEKYTGHICW